MNDINELILEFQQISNMSVVLDGLNSFWLLISHGQFYE